MKNRVKKSAMNLDQGDIVFTLAGERLLPGEQLPFRAEYSAELKAGRYRVLASFQYEAGVITSSIDFAVP